MNTTTTQVIAEYCRSNSIRLAILAAVICTAYLAYAPHASRKASAATSAVRAHSAGNAAAATSSPQPSPWKGEGVRHSETAAHRRIGIAVARMVPLRATIGSNALSPEENISPNSG